ncbi:hypothetical protein TWF694_005606 [Orbilia ellipsospora]|uniref:Uncharacterized protein n=1 Tax=Orbilia ellipsospora TaxID=2528407 RepID=A0AAV9WTL2_9PEZI
MSLLITVLLSVASRLDAFYIEAESKYSDQGPWQLCRTTDPPSTKYELSIFAIDPARTNCEKQGGDPEWFLYRPLAESDPYDRYKRDDIVPVDPKKFYLGGSKPWPPTDLTPIIFTGSVLNSALELGTEQSDQLIPASFRILRGGSNPEISGNNPPQAGDIVQFLGHDLLTSLMEKVLEIDLIGTTDQQVPKYAIIRATIGADEIDYPSVNLRVSNQRRINDLIIEAGLAREHQSFDALNPIKGLKSFFGNIKDTVKKKARDAKEVMQGKIKAGVEGGVKKFMGTTARTHIHGGQEDEEAKEDFPVGYPGYESGNNSPDPAEKGGVYYGNYNYDPSIVGQDYVGQQEQAQNQGQKRIEIFEVEKSKKDT